MENHALGRPLRLYLLAVSAAGLLCVWRFGSLASLGSALTWAFIGASAVVRSRRAPIGSNALTFTLGGSLFLSAVYSAGAAGALSVLVVGGLAELFVGRRVVAKELFNIGHRALGVTAVHLILSRFGPDQPAAWLGGGVVYSLLNWLVVGTASAMALKVPWFPHVSRLVRDSVEPASLEVLLAVGTGYAAREAGLAGVAGATVVVLLMNREIGNARLHRAIFGELPVGVAIWDRFGRCAFANRALCDMSGLGPDAWRKLHLSQLGSLLVGAGDPAGYIRAVQTGRNHAERVRLRPVSGEAVPVELIIHPWHRGGEFWGALTVMRDIRADLDAEVNSRLAAVGRLAAGAAHEIRNPLTSVRGFLQLAERQVVGGPKQWIQLALGELDRINALVRDLLVYARPQQRVEEPVEFISLARETLGLVHERAAASRVKASVQVEPGTPDLVHVLGDRNQLKQVLLNLFQNALEVMPSGGELDVFVSVREHRLLCRVVDTGPGIPPDVRERLFEPFFTTKEHGTGLGLMISRQIVQQHRGTIEVQSEVGGGTSMLISLPIYYGPVSVAPLAAGAGDEPAANNVISLSSRRG